MTRETAQKLVPNFDRIRDFAEGKDVEYKDSLGWHLGTNMAFDMPPDHYRIKPREPREFWLVFNDEYLTGEPSGVYPVEQTGWKGQPLPNQIRVREILTDETP